MNVILGKDVIIQFYKEEEYRNFVCAENITFRGQTETKSVKTIGDGIWARPRLQSNSYTIEVTGIIPYDEPDQVTAFDLTEYWKQGVGINYQMIFNDQTGETYTAIYGVALVTNCEVSGPADFAGASFTLQGIGEPIIGVPPTCESAIVNYTLTRQGLTFIYRVAILSVTTGSVPRYDWRLDGGSINTSFDTGWPINVSSTSSYLYGTHTLEIWPVCENGARGTKLTRQFTIPFG